MSSQKVISFATMKGGTGKTNVAFNLIGFLSKAGKKVLVIDFDAQGNMTNDFHINQLTQDYDSIGDVLENNISFKDVIVESPIAEMPTVDLIPSNRKLTDTEIRIIRNNVSTHGMMKEWLKHNHNHVKKYDYIICDTPPVVNVPTQNALFISDSIILVTEVGMHSIQGAMNIIDRWDDICKNLRIENKVVGLLINKYDKRVKLAQDFKDYVDANPVLKKLAFDTIIPQNIKLQETSVVNLPISYYDVKNTGYTAYISFVKELIKMEVI